MGTINVKATVPAYLYNVATISGCGYDTTGADGSLVFNCGLTNAERAKTITADAANTLVDGNTYVTSTVFRWRKMRTKTTFLCLVAAQPNAF